MRKICLALFEGTLSCKGALKFPHQPPKNKETNINRLTPNAPYMGRTAPLTSKRFILYIYSTNISTEYFKHALYSPFFSSKCSLFHTANLFGSVLFTFYIQGVLKLKKIIPAPKG